MTTEDISQAKVIAFLSDPKTHGGAPVECISTHGAHVFLAGDRAYKLKRAVKFSFLDFSTAEKRRAMLETELHINAGSAPDIYLKVRSIGINSGGHLQFDAEPGIEWVLEMRRFNQSALLDDIARRGELDEKIIDDLAAAIAACHRRAPVKQQSISQTFAAMALENVTGAAAGNRKAARLETELRRACASDAAFLDDRSGCGFVRRCHGDLHLRNIVLLDKEPVPFDALEFDDALATGDVYYDLAFLLMDLDHRALRPLANRLLNRYVILTDDLEGLRGLPLFLAVRAAIRAKVTAISAETAATPGARQDLLKESASYLDLANTYLPPSTPCLVGIGGLSGTGKSAVAAGLAPDIAPAPGALTLRSDIFRKRLAGVAETDRLPATAYTPESHARVYRTLLTVTQRALGAGHSVIVDAVFADMEERTAVEEVAAQHGVRFVGLWLDASLDARLNRVGRRIGDASDANASVVQKQERYALGDLTWSKIDAGGALADVQRAALAAVRERFEGAR